MKTFTKTIKSADVPIHLAVSYPDNGTIGMDETKINSEKIIELLDAAFPATDESPSCFHEVTIPDPNHKKYEMAREGGATFAYMDTLTLVTLNEYAIFKSIGVLTDRYSPTVRFCHGAGIRYNGKGILITGEPDAGKSTIAASLSEDILSDDTVLVGQNKIQRIGAYGIKDNHERSNGLKYFNWLKDDLTITNLDLVIHLNPTMSAESIDDITGDGLTPAQTFDPLMGDGLYDSYTEKGPIPFNVPIIQIGTDGEIYQTVLSATNAIDTTL